VVVRERSSLYHDLALFVYEEVVLHKKSPFKMGRFFQLFFHKNLTIKSKIMGLIEEKRLDYNGIKI
jgi:hypothetical protein